MLKKQICFVVKKQKNIKTKTERQVNSYEAVRLSASL